MVPAEDAVEVAGGDVDLHRLGRHLHRAFEHVQLRADGEHVEQRGLAAHLACQRGVALARGVAGAQQQPPRLRRAPMVCISSRRKRAQCGRMDQHHALPGQPDAAVAGGEVHQPAQVGVAGQRGQGGVGHRWIIDKQGCSVHRCNPRIERRLHQIINRTGSPLSISSFCSAQRPFEGVGRASVSGPRGSLER
jgi:hypothetical protein